MSKQWSVNGKYRTEIHNGTAVWDSTFLEKFPVVRVHLHG